MSKHNGPTPRNFPKEEAHFHEPYADFKEVDSVQSIVINERNQIPCSAGDHPAKSSAFDQAFHRRRG